MLQQRGDGHRLRVLQALPFADVASASIDGDEVAFTVLYQRFRSELIRRAQRLGSDDPEGVADEVLVGGITALRRLDALEETQFRQYLHRSVRNRVIDEARRGQRRVSMDLVGDVGDIERESSRQSPPTR